MPARAHQRRRGNPEVIMEPFLDIVTNVIGVLFFVIIHITLSASRAKGLVTTPLSQVTDTEPISVECAGGKAFFSHAEELLEQAGRIIDQTLSEDGSWSDVERQIEEANIHNLFYTLHLVVQWSGDITIELEVSTHDHGETSRELQKSTSTFRQELEKLDPAKNHVFFRVRPDSLEAFYTARRLATETGFRTGWEPYEIGSSIRFGPGGIITPGTD